MTVTVKSPRKVVHSNGATVSSIAHDYLLESASHLRVFADDVELTLGVHFTVTGVGNPAGFTVNISSPGSWSADYWAVEVVYPIDQPSDVDQGGQFGARFEAALDRVARSMQTLYDAVQRAPKVAPTTPVGVEYSIDPPVAGNVVGWSADGTALENKGEVAHIEDIAANIGAIVAVSGHLDEIDDVAGALAPIALVAGSITSVNAVGANIGSVVTVAGNIADITTTASISGHIATVAGISADIPVVAGISGQVSTVAGISADISTVAADIASVQSAAANMPAIVAAPAAAALAQKWATEAEDVPVTGGLYSAFHWAMKAAAAVTGGIAGAIHAAVGKTTPVDNDELALVDSADGWSLKKLTWANLKAALRIPPFIPLTNSTNVDDWNTLESSGWFGQLVGGSNTNSPGGSEYYFLHNADYGSGYTLQQMAFPRRTVAGRIGLRSRHNAVWESWRYLPWADTVLHLAGGTMTGPITLPAGTTGAAPLNIPHGVSPTAPVNGDLWLPASGGFYGRRNNVTVALWDTSSLARPDGSEINAGVATTDRVWAAADVFTFVQRHRRVSRKTSDQSFTTQTLADVTGLSFSVLANEVWAFEAEILFEKSADANAYPNIAINGPAGGYVRGGLHINMHQTNELFGGNAPVTGYNETPFTFGVSGAVPGNARLWGYIAVGATAGTVFIRGARNGTAGTATIKDGSIMKAYRIA